MSGEHLYRSTCERETLHSVARSESGGVLSQECRDPRHRVQLWAQASESALESGSVVMSPPTQSRAPGLGAFSACAAAEPSHVSARESLGLCR
jgi:hypothetical protein